MKKFMMLMIAALTISSVSVFAQDKGDKKDTTQHSVLYSCAMHPGVTAISQVNVPNAVWICHFLTKRK
jgi:hypothetical protein